MASQVRAVPSNVRELHDYLDQMRENKGHVKSVAVNPSNCHLEIILDGAAHFFGKPDAWVPIKRGKLDEATKLVEKLWRDAQAGYPLAGADVQALFDMIDPSLK
jgi:hypothetical protein